MPGYPWQRFRTTRNTYAEERSPVYIARIVKKGQSFFFIRESYIKDGIYQSRDLIDLGTDPTQYVRYPSSTTFYIDETVEDRLREKNVHVSQNCLETLFWPYVRPDVKYRYRFFRSRKTVFTPNPTIPSNQFHIFDRRRIHFLKFAQMDQQRIYRASDKLFQVLAGKSRDEIEQYFMLNETILKPKEWKSYVYVIFNIQHHFTQSFAREMPQALDQDQVDNHFIDNLCKLNQDPHFFTGENMPRFLHDYLKRYAIIFFDATYGESKYLEDMYDAWMNQRRHYRTPVFKSSQELFQQAVRVFETPAATLKEMTVEALTKLYRKKAKDLHPDHGGTDDQFIELTNIYEALMQKKARTKK